MSGVQGIGYRVQVSSGDKLPVASSWLECSFAATLLRRVFWMIGFSIVDGDVAVPVVVVDTVPVPVVGC